MNLKKHEKINDQKTSEIKNSKSIFKEGRNAQTSNQVIKSPRKQVL